MRRLRCALAGLCFCVSLASPSVSAQSTPTPDTHLTVPLDSWTAFDDLLTQLGIEASLLSEDSQRLAASLLVAQSRLDSLSSQLQSSQTEASELSRLLTRSSESLQISVESVRSALAARSLELWIWRGAAAAASVVAILALVR